MSVIRPSNAAEQLTSSGLSDDECTAIHDAAYRLMVDGRSLGVGSEFQDGIVKMIFVLDVQGNRYTITRNAGTYLLLDPAFGIIAVFNQFKEVVEELKSSL